jgi:hypothetical protein
MVYGSTGKNITKLEKGEQRLNYHTATIHAANEQHEI